MAMDKTAKQPRVKRRGLNHTQEQILLLVSELRFLTRKAIWRLLFSLGSYTHAGETLHTLVANGYLLRVSLTRARGNGEFIYTLGRIGALTLRELGVEETVWWARPYELSQASFSLLTHNSAIGLFHIALRLFVREHDGYEIIESRTCYQMERRPPRLPTIREGRQAPSAVIPDSWVHVKLPDGRRFALWIEIDQGTESKTKYLTLLRERLSLIWSGQYEQYFGTPSVQMCYLTIGTSEYREARTKTLCQWTEELLANLRLTAWKDVFLFAGMGQDIEEAQALFLDRLWQRPYTRQAVSLFTPLQQQEESHGVQNLYPD